VNLRHGSWLLTATITAVVAVGVAACGTGGSEDRNSANKDGGLKAGPGVDAARKTITVSLIGPLTGPAAVVGTPVLAGARAFWNATNAAGGLPDGWKVKLLVKDNVYEPQRHVQHYNAIRDESAVIISFGSAATRAIKSAVDADGILTAPIGLDSVWSTDKNMLPLGTPYGVDVANLLSYITDDGRQRPKVGLVYQNDEFGTDVLHGWDAAQKDLGFTSAAKVSYKPGDTDFTAQVQKLKASGAQALVLATIPSATGPLLGAMATLGYRPKLYGLSPAFIEQLVTRDGTPDGKPTPVAQLISGATMTAIAAPWGSDVPGMAEVVRRQKQHVPKAITSSFLTYGYAQQQAIAAVLAQAIKAGDLSRAGLVEARSKIGAVDFEGLLPRGTYGEAGTPPSRESIIVRVDPKHASGFQRVLAPDYRSKTGDSLALREE